MAAWSPSVFSAGATRSLCWTAWFVVIGWLTYDLTRSALVTSLALGLGALPMLFIAPLGGVLADAWDRRTLFALALGAWLLRMFRQGRRPAPAEA